MFSIVLGVVALFGANVAVEEEIVFDEGSQEQEEVVIYEDSEAQAIVFDEECEVEAEESVD